MTSNDSNHYVAGVLDSSARIYHNAIAITLPCPRLRKALQDKFGGSVTKNRLVVSGRVARLTLLRTWEPYTRSRRVEVEDMIARLDPDHIVPGPLNL